MRNWKVITVLTLAITIGAFFVGRSSNIEKEKTGVAEVPVANVIKRGTEIGDLAPEFQLAQLDGSKLSLDNLRGQPAVLVFWASWCGFCREEAPHVNKLADDFASRGVRVFGVNVRESQARTESGIKTFGIRYSVVRDTDGNTARDYNVEGIPTVLFLDQEGKVRYVGNGVPSDYSERLETLLGETTNEGS
jgi:thiol-disulfide isomerase/thioredoxin